MTQTRHWTALLPLEHHRERWINQIHRPSQKTFWPVIAVKAQVELMKASLNNDYTAGLHIISHTCVWQQDLFSCSFTPQFSFDHHWLKANRGEHKLIDLIGFWRNSDIVIVLSKQHHCPWLTQAIKKKSISTQMNASKTIRCHDKLKDTQHNAALLHKADISLSTVLLAPVLAVYRLPHSPQFNTFGHLQHVKGPTHIQGQTLNVVISKGVDICSVDGKDLDLLLIIIQSFLWDHSKCLVNLCVC